MKTMTPLDIFIKVVESGSFSAAARYFNMTPSAISRQISQLEAELNARLFQRTTRQQSLTEAGHIYWQYAQRINAEVHAAKLAVSQLSDQPSGILHISTEKDFAETFIQPLLAEFFKRYPDIQLRLSLDTNVVDLVAGSIDVAIRIGHLEDSNLVARRLMSSASVVCASPAYLKQHSIPQTPAELQNHNCLSFRIHSQQTTWHLGSEGDMTDVAVSGNLKVNSLAMLRNAAINGLGVIFIPQWFIQKELDEGKLQCLGFTSSTTPVHAVFANSRQLAPKIRVFIDFLVEQLNG